MIFEVILGNNSRLEKGLGVIQGEKETKRSLARITRQNWFVENTTNRATRREVAQFSSINMD